MILLLSNNDPRRVYEELLLNNEDFRGFIENNKKYNAEQMFVKYNLEKHLTILQ